MEQKIALLINIAAQKLVIIAERARGLHVSGYEAETEFCWLTQLQAIIFRLKNGGLISLKDLEGLETIIKNTGEKGMVPYRPVTVQPNIEVSPSSGCCSDNGVKDDVNDVVNQVNYQNPTLKLTQTDLNEGDCKYEVGHGITLIDVKWKANKYPLTNIIVNFPNNSPGVSSNLTGTHTQISIDLSPAQPVTRVIHGYYNDRELYKGQHLLAEDRLYFKTTWPCYWGIGPINALDNPATINAFILSLKKEICCVACVDANLTTGNVLYFFYPYLGKQKNFLSNNGVIHNSYKGLFQGFRTQSLINNNIPGSTTYGVIRSDQAGIGELKVCVKDVEFPDGNVVTPTPDPVTPTAPVITYESVWSVLLCASDQVISYESIWSVLKCNLEESTV